MEDIQNTKDAKKIEEFLSRTIRPLLLELRKDTFIEFSAQILALHTSAISMVFGFGYKVSDKFTSFRGIWGEEHQVNNVWRVCN